MLIRNPETGVLDYTLTVDSITNISDKAKLCRSNQKSWKAKGVAHRIEIMKQWIDALTEREEEIVAALTIDTARAYIAKVEFQSALGLIQGWCYKSPLMMTAPEPKMSMTYPSVEIQQQREPYQLVGAISPWNFPLLLALIDVVPALCAGSSVLLKASEVTPRFLAPLEESIKAVPELYKVFQMVNGGPEQGKALIDEVDVVCFTGSVPTGQKIALHCAQKFIPCFLELGGKDPAIVLADADLEVASDAIVRSCLGATGQACQSLERVYVDDKIYDDFVALIIEKSKVITPTKDGGILGPMIFSKQGEKIQEQLEDALAKGATLEVGQDVENINGAQWCHPIVLTNVDHTMTVMTEETFGPVIPIMRFRTEEEAIRLSNDSIFGLSASVFSKDIEKAIAVADKIEAGAIGINDASLTNRVFDAEKNSFKLSGLYGSRMGNDGFLRFFRKRAVMIQQNHPQKLGDFGA